MCLGDGVCLIGVCGCDKCRGGICGVVGDFCVVMGGVTGLCDDVLRISFLHCGVCVCFWFWWAKWWCVLCALYCVGGCLLCCLVKLYCCLCA